jgi:DNA-binding SARP family transcriptional activator
MSEDQPCLGAPVRQARLRVLGSFELWSSVGADVTPTLSTDERRLLAVLAASPAPPSARSLATLLWPELATDTALGTLLGVQDSLGDLIDTQGGRPRLADWIEVDLARALVLLRGWQHDPFQVDSASLTELVELLSQDLLPGWGDAWARHERDRLHQVQLHALESLCTRLTALGQHELAIRAGGYVVAAEPLREEARRALIEAHLAAGNVSEAVHQYDKFVQTCAKLGLVPGAELSAFFPPSPAWPVLHVRRPVHVGAASVGRGLWLDPQPRRVQAGAGAARA